MGQLGGNLLNPARESRAADRRKAEAEREGDFLVYAVARPLMFVVWALILWGTAVALAAVYVLLAAGPAAAVRVLLPQTTLDLINTGLGTLALVVWITVVAATRRSARGRSGASTPHRPRPR